MLIALDAMGGDFAPGPIVAGAVKAIAADPNRADAYFIKGSLMMGDSKQDKDGKLQAPPGDRKSVV